MEIKESVRRQFSGVAANYAVSPVHSGGPDLEAMLSAAALGGGERVLDLGCGPGHTALAFAPRVAEVAAVDLSGEMLALGRRLATERGLGNVTFQRADVEGLPFAAASFDVVTSRFSAHHYPHPANALAEVARVLKPSGVFLLVDTVSPNEPAADTYLNAVEVLRDPSHVRDHSRDQWLAMLGAAGLSAELLGTWALRLEFSSWVARMATPAAAVTQIRALFDAAPREVRDALTVEPNGSFCIPLALFRGRLDRA